MSSSPAVSVAETEGRLRSVVHSLLLIVGAFLTGIALAVAGLTLLVSLGIASSDGVVGRVVLLSLQFVGFGVAVAVYAHLQNAWDLIEARVPTLRDLGWAVAGFVGLFVGAYAIGVIVQVLGLEAAENTVVTIGRENPELFLYMIPVAILLVGPAEELVFRGIVQGLFRRAYGVWPAILITSLLFGAAHILALTGPDSAKFTYIAIAGVLGIVLGTIYEKTRNIVVPSLVHGVWNAMLFAIQYLTATNQLQLPS